MATWADALFAIDAKWWEMYLPEVRESFPGALFSTNDFPGRRITRLNKPYKAFGNSGAGAIALAVKAGASRVILLGYDCQATGGKMHHFGDHPHGLGNAGSMPKWPEKFARLADSVPDSVEIINCSRETALTVFPRGDLESALCL